MWDGVRRVGAARQTGSRHAVRASVGIFTQDELRAARDHALRSKHILLPLREQLLVRRLCIGDAIGQLVAGQLRVLATTQHRRQVAYRVRANFMSNIVSLAHIHYRYILWS